MKILCIEDETDIATLLDDVLVSQGHEVKTCHNGEDGLTMIENEKFDMVFLDLNMPKVSGTQVVDALAKDDLTNDMNIAILTANTLSDSEQLKLKNKGVKEILQKPISVDRMLEIVAKYE